MEIIINLLMKALLGLSILMVYSTLGMVVIRRLNKREILFALYLAGLLVIVWEILFLTYKLIEKI